MNKQETQSQKQQPANQQPTNSAGRPIWFKAKHYGYGWYHATWQAGLILVLYLVIVVGSAFFIESAENNLDENTVTTFLIIDLIATAVLIVVSAMYGEKAKWRWGKKDEDTNSKK
jgi:uncharacterized membrane protein (DUF485 family)